MSASDKKKLRKELEAASLTDKQLSQKKEDKQLKTQTMTFIVVMILVVAIALSSMGMNWYNSTGIPARSTTALTVGDYELSNVDLNYYFIDSVNAFYDDAYEQYSTYTALYVQLYYGLDMTVALNAQYYNENTGETWADYFLNDAIGYAEATYVLYGKAMEAGFELNETQQANLNTSLSNAKASAVYYGYSSLDDYLKAYYGSGANEETFTNYYTVNAIADAYYSAYADTLTYTREELDTFSEENYNAYSTFDYAYYYINIKYFLPEGVELADATEEQRNDAAAAAKAAADALTVNNNLDDLNTAISAMEINAESTVSATEFTKTVYSNISTVYSAWVVDTTRTPGEATVVEYESDTDEDELLDGYYVVLFQGREDYTEPMRAVRHILINFEGGTTENGTTVYSDEEKQTALDKAQALYDQWVADGATEEDFIALVADNSGDTGSNANGGLYENVYNGYMLESFNDWLFDETRQPGDHGIVETVHGYHLMYYVGEEEISYRDYCIEYTLRSTDVSEWYQGLLETVTSTKGSTKYIYTGLILASESST